jgi:protease IV
MSSDPHASPPPPEGQPPYVIPVRYSTPPPPPVAPPPRRSGWTLFLLIALAVSIGLNIVAMMALHLTDTEDSSTVTEHYHSGKSSAHDKIAIVKMDGVIMDGSLGFVHKQIDQAASDSAVKAVVLRISSPGGSITGSDDLYRRLIELRDGTNPQQKGGKKPLIVSMGAMAASGGYYIAMPAEYIFAEVTTMTGSIGVYAAFPNVAEMGEKFGFGINLIKAGAVKDSGSPFKFMTAPEREVWQDMINQSYDRFTEVVEKGRGSALKIKPRGDVPWTAKEIPDIDKHGKPIQENGQPKMLHFVRQVADGGVWTAKDAEKLGLIDKIDYLDAAIKETAQRAKLADGVYKVVSYEKPQTLASMIFGSQGKPAQQLDASKLTAGATPRLWFMTPQAEVAGLLAAMGKD